MIAAMHPTQASAKGRDASPDEQPDTGREDSQSLEERQRADPDLAPIMDYIQTGVLPDGERTRELALTWNQYELLEGVRYHVEHDKTLRVILLKGDRKKVFNEAHAGPFGGHLRGPKMYGQLAKHYWWPKMRADVISWSRACLLCASRRVGKAITPLLTPIPVSGPLTVWEWMSYNFPRATAGTSMR